MTVIDDSVAQRFWAKVERNDGDCWLWKSSTMRDGYGMFKIGAKNVLAHRVAVFLNQGQIPEGLEVDHLCRVRNCVNPSHLELVTRAENMARSIARCAKITHCPQGHPYDEANTLVGSRKYTHRVCRTCHRDRQRAYVKRKRLLKEA